jgi:uncharacterized membrane protein
MGIVISGAAPSTAILQLTITYQVEYVATGNVLID